jgi:hypothetical protein
MTMEYFSWMFELRKSGVRIISKVPTTSLFTSWVVGTQNWKSTKVERSSAIASQETGVSPQLCGSGDSDSPSLI